MFKTVKSYIIVTDNSFVIKSENNQDEIIFEFQTYIPNVPFYHHLFDDKDDIKNITNHIKSLKMKDILVIMPDDTLDTLIDQTILDNYFYVCKSKRVEIDFQSLLLSQDNKGYISVSKTTRNLVIQYIKEGKSFAKKYYDKEFKDVEQIKTDMQKLYIDCEYGSKTVYINNINNNMELFENVGEMVSITDIFTNAMNSKN